MDTFMQLAESRVRLSHFTKPASLRRRDKGIMSKPVKQCQQKCTRCKERCAYVSRHGKLIQNIPANRQKMKHACNWHRED